SCCAAILALKSLGLATRCERAGVISVAADETGATIMGAKSQERAAGRSSGLPLDVYNRQSWRPPAAGAAESLVSGIIRRAELNHQAARLSAWYEQFNRRVRPWTGWFPLSMYFPAMELPSAGGRRAAPAIRLAILQAMRTTTETMPQRE